LHVPVRGRAERAARGHSAQSRRGAAVEPARAAASGGGSTLRAPRTFAMADETVRAIEADAGREGPRPTPAAAAVKVGVSTEQKGPHLSAYFRGFGAAEGVEQVAVADASGTTFAEAKTGLGERSSTLRAYRDYRELLREFRPALALVSLAADRAP